MNVVKEALKYLFGISLFYICIFNFKLSLLVYGVSVGVVFLILGVYQLSKNYKIIPIRIMCWYWLYKTKRNHKKMIETGSYNNYLNSKRWSDIKSSAISAMDCKCEFCSSRPVSVHHIFYPKRINYGYEGIGSLLVVCKNCHKILHGMKSQIITGLCPLCNKNSSQVNLKINIERYDLSRQSVCINCYQIAIGKRYKTNNLTFVNYLKFVKDWQLNAWKKFQ